MTVKLKKGALRKQLGVPKSKKIPKTLIRKITATEIGSEIKNPTEIGKEKIKVTRLLKKRAQFDKSFFKK
jgi:hypothetical protein